MGNADDELRAGEIGMNIRIDNLTSPEVIDLIRLHLQGMSQHSPAESVHALASRRCVNRRSRSGASGANRS